MEVTLCGIIVAVLCQNFIVVKTYESVMFDLTRPVNELIATTISQDDFKNDVESAFGLINANPKTSTIFYATDGSSVEEFEKHKQAFCSIMNETLQRFENLLISWTVNITEIPKPGAGFSHIQEFNGCNPKLLLNFHDETTCEYTELQYDTEFHHLVNYLNISGSFAGVGYNESLINCESRFRVHYSQHVTPIVLIRMRFGATNGVTESFGLFQSRMNFFFGKYVRNVNSFYKSFIIYYHSPNCVGDDNHQHLLITFATIWTAANKEKGSMLLQVPNSRFDASTSTEFTIIPRFFQYVVGKPVQWSLFMLTTGFKNHQLIFVNSDIWNDYWNKINSSTQRMPSMPSRVGIVLDCTYRGCRENSITFPLNGNRSDLKIIMDLKSYNQTWQSSLNENVGCVVEETSFWTLNESYVEHNIRECQRINGRHYILKTQLIIDWSNEQDKYSFHFENVIRKELHALNWFRKSILKREPAGKVYFELYYVETHRPYQELALWERSSLFCQDLKPTVNLYLEAIFNWAKLESFPIIILFIPDFFSLTPLPSWFSYMRRLNYPYTDWDTDTLKYSLPIHTSPSFLMQNYLKSIHGWTMDTCIDWNSKSQEIQKDFFHNEVLGAVLGFIKNQTLNKADYTMLLQFLFYRFRLLKFSTGSENFRELLIAIENCLPLEYFDSTTKIYFKYNVPSLFTQNDFSSFQSFLFQLKKTNAYEMLLVNGVHVEFAVGVLDSGGQVVFNSNSSSLKPVNNMMKYAKLLNFSCGIEISSINECYEMLEQLDFNNVYSELIYTVNYIICKEQIEYSTLSYETSKLQLVLDSHLALKRIMDQLVPHLQVYFRVEFGFDVAEDNATLDQYSSFLALFKSFGTAYNISYFVVEAFDNQMEETKTGWWGIKNYSDLTNPQSYVEKITVSRGQIMWYPPTRNAPVPEGQDVSVVIVVSSVSSAIVLFLCILGVYFGLRYRTLRHLSRFLSDSEVQDFINGRDATKSEPGTMEMNWMGSIEQTKFSQEYKLDLSDLTIDIEKVLGSGAFGTVFKGFARDIAAAIKRPNRYCSKSTFMGFLTEVKVLAYIGKHENVVEFFGAYITEINKGVLYIATEFCAGGSLESFLRTTARDIRKTSSNQYQNVETEQRVPQFYQLYEFSMGIAQGMEYIGSKRVIHGDLATRNVFLDGNMVCKIGDFGLSRKLYKNEKYVKKSQEPLPWRWMAPESLDQMEFTSKSDMWSYGVTLWEIYSLGKTPYAGLHWSVDFSSELQTGLRLPAPEFASKNIFDKMVECWNLNSDERPTFTDMIKFFKNLREDDYAILGSPE